MTFKWTVDTRKLHQIAAQVKRDGSPRYFVADGVEYGLENELHNPRKPHFMRNATDYVRPWYFKNIGKALMAGELDAHTRSAAFQVQADAALHAPFLTGALRNSIHTEKAE